MTLLSICQDAADEIDILRPATIIGNTEPDARTLLRLANKVGRRIMKVFPWQILRKEKTFTSVAGETQTGILPSDFDRFVPETFWNRSQSKLVTGPISAVQWQGLKALDTTPSEFPKFILRGGSILTLPSLSAGETLAFEYISENWCQSDAGSAQAYFQADDDTGILDEELLTRGVIFEYLAAKGQPLAKAASDYEEYFDALIENDQPNARTLLAGDIFGGGRRFSGAPPVENFNSLLS